MLIPLRWLLGRKSSMTVKINRMTAQNVVADLTRALADPERKQFEIGFATQDWRPAVAVAVVPGAARGH